ncbi:MAG: hypothetical protein IH971_06400 [Candidatus Marinimicrobia bacterium]|nr:hypothetical protein [Candidatus Neomarinimicrobiota bacterium]
MRPYFLLAAIVCVACAVEPGDDSVTYGEQFVLSVGASEIVGPEDVEIGFHSLLHELRCPLDVDCIWAGRARIQVWFHVPGQDTVYLEPLIEAYVFSADEGAHKRVYTRRHSIALRQLDPYPIWFVEASDSADLAASLTFSLNPVPMESDRLIFVDGSSFDAFRANVIDAFEVDSVSVSGDTLVVRVRYSGGCKEHDFFVVGSQDWVPLAPPLMDVVVIHDGHLDACEAYLWRYLLIGLTSIREQRGSGVVLIAVQSAPDTVLYSF